MLVTNHDPSSNFVLMPQTKRFREEHTILHRQTISPQEVDEERRKPKMLSFDQLNAPIFAPPGKSLIEQVFDRSAELKIAFLQVSMHLEDRWRERIFAQLDKMLDPEDWDHDELLPSVASFRTLLRLILYVRPTRVPGLGLSASGDLVASWSDRNDHLTLECSSFDKIVWSLIVTENGVRKTAGGSATISRIESDLKSYNLTRWLGV